MEKITIAEVRKLAREYYDRGGDGIIECYEDYQIQADIDAGMTTKRSWIKSFEISYDIEQDIRNS